MVREHADPARPDVTVALDDRAGALGADDFELAVEVVASVCVASRRSGFPVRLVSASGALDGAPLGDETVLLDLLAGAGQHPADDPVPPCGGRRRPGRPGAGGGRRPPRPGDLQRWAAAGRRFGGTIVVVAGRHDDVPAAPAGVHLVTAPTAAQFAARLGTAAMT